jgi:putative PEP-CTERM system histidine kinase
MTSEGFATAASWTYGVVAAAYLLFAVRIAAGAWRNGRARVLLGALAATAAWAMSCIPLARSPSGLALLAESVANALRYGLWYAFLAALLAPARGLPRPARLGVAVALAASVVFGNALRVSEMLGFGPRAGFALQLALAVLGLLFVEQVVRLVQQRWAIKPLALALAAIFAFDLLLYADAMLYAHVDGDLWLARGFAYLIVVPFLMVATVRNPDWTIDLHVSRKAVFHTSTLLLSGLFLLALSFAGYVVRYVGGDWGRALEIELLFAGALFAVLVATSGQFRARLKIFVSKHFFSYRYDYREEWLRFTRTLDTDTPLLTVQQRIIVALADLVESPAGALWLHAESRGYAQATHWNGIAIDAVERTDAALPSYLERTGWIIGIDECRRHPERYQGLELPAWLDSFPSAWLIVPLASRDHLLGFVVLAAPRSALDVDWEVRDLLKTASRHAASYLGEIRASEALLEVGKFDAFNRMSAFVVHDLKNLVAQLSLMLRNAERHRDNPAFQTDMLGTVQHVVSRMNKLMLQLRAEGEPVESRRHVDLAALVDRICSSRAQPAIPVEFTVRERASVLAHEERLEHVVGHLLQNAIDASSPGQVIGVLVDRMAGFGIVEIVDQGSGMTPEFVRDRLFKPFQTTKAAGMGIGVYESAQYLEKIGGDVTIESRPGAGTRVVARVPCADAPAHVQQAREEAPEHVT